MAAHAHRPDAWQTGRSRMACCTSALLFTSKPLGAHDVPKTLSVPLFLTLSSFLCLSHTHTHTHFCIFMYTHAIHTAAHSACTYRYTQKGMLRYILALSILEQKTHI